MITRFSRETATKIQSSSSLLISLSLKMLLLIFPDKHVGKFSIHNV